MQSCVIVIKQTGCTKEHPYVYKIRNIYICFYSITYNLDKYTYLMGVTHRIISSTI